MRARYGDRYEIVCGADSLIVDFVLWGARSWIAGASGFLPAEHSEILRVAARGDNARAQKLLQPLPPLLLDMEHSHYGHKVRAGLAAHGLPGGRTRQPVQPLPEARHASWRRCERSRPGNTPLAVLST